MLVPAGDARRGGGEHEAGRGFDEDRVRQPRFFEPRTVHVYQLGLLRYSWPEVEIELRCRSGFYVRSLARDLGLALGTGGHCSAITRTAVGPFTEAISTPLDQVPDPLTSADLISLDQWQSLRAS